MENKTIKLPSHDLCTGCSACINACQQKCISLIGDEMDVVYPIINEEKCIRCGKCIKVCPNNHDFFYPRSEAVYAGWNNNRLVREKSASGGIAASIYRYAIHNGYKTFGVQMTSEGLAQYIEICDEEDISKVLNSKYVFSHMEYIYEKIQYYNKNNEKIIFIGLPCQTAGLLGYFGGKRDNLILVDIICHGTCPEIYLQQHIRETGKARHVDSVLFRDPFFGTHKFVFSLYEKGKRTYSSIVHGRDVYQLGYHEALIYRENCYNCRYARPERVGDITISDFSGLGKKSPWEFSRESVSCIICSSEKGKKLLDNLEETDEITLVQRPPEEAFLFEKQLITPSIPHDMRSQFVYGYKKTHDFEKVCNDVLSAEIRRNRIRMLLKKDEIREALRKIIPDRLKKSMKRILRKENG